jgi:glycerophosphoryl diester phosphodiesterase
MTHDTSATPPASFLVFGHRGSPRRFAENTLASFEEALRAGADGFETDLRLLSDRTAILYHDDELAEEEIEQMSAVDVQDRGVIVQQLSDLAPFASRTTMILEVKRSKWEQALLDHVSEWPNVIVSSFDHATIAELRRRNASFPLGLVTYGYQLDFAEYAKRLGVQWSFPSHRYVDAELVTSLHAAGIRVAPWTPNRPREWQRLQRIGCDGMITDYPGEAVEWRNSLEAPHGVRS